MTSDGFIALQKLWDLAGGDPAALDRVELTGADPILPTNFKIGTAASAVIAATALAATEIWRLRTGREQSVAVDLRAAVAAYSSSLVFGERFGPLRLGGMALVLLGIAVIVLPVARWSRVTAIPG